MPSYLSYKNNLKAVLDANDDNIEAWITVKGNHIPIMKGQSKEEAVKSFLEKKNSTKGMVKKAVERGHEKPKFSLGQKTRHGEITNIEYGKFSTTPIYKLKTPDGKAIYKYEEELSRTASHEKKKSNGMFAQQITGKEPFDPMKADKSFRYQLLDRMRQDNDYWLKNGKNDKNLWAGNPKEQIATMRKLYNSLPEKPEWLTEEQINEYEKKMLGSSKSGKQTFYKNVSGKQFGTPSGRTVIENELLTEKEMQKYGADPTSEKFEKKDLGKKDHHYFFGARFENEKQKSTTPALQKGQIKLHRDIDNRDVIIDPDGAYTFYKDGVKGSQNRSLKGQEGALKELGEIGYKQNTNVITTSSSASESIAGGSDNEQGFQLLEIAYNDVEFGNNAQQNRDSILSAISESGLSTKEADSMRSLVGSMPDSALKNVDAFRSHLQKSQPASIEETEEAIENWASEAYEKHQANSISKEYNLLKKQVKNIEKVLKENRMQQSAVPAGWATYSKLGELRKEEDRLIKQLRDAQQELDDFVHYEMD